MLLHLPVIDIASVSFTFVCFTLNKGEGVPENYALHQFVLKRWLKKHPLSDDLIVIYKNQQLTLQFELFLLSLCVYIYNNKKLL